MTIPEQRVGHGIDSQKKYGVWRWEGLRENSSIIMPKLHHPILDVGGALGPLGFNSIIVDKLEKDINGNPIKYHSITEIDFDVKTIFSSHLLEHLPNPVKHLQRCSRLIVPGGYCIVHVPSIYNMTNHPYFKDSHMWLFAADGLTVQAGYSHILPLRKLMEMYFELEYIEYVSDCSILAIGRRVWPRPNHHVM